MAAPITLYNATHLSGAATTVVLTGPGTLHAIVVGTSAGTITAYDNTSGSGTVLSVISAAGTFVFDLACKVGLTLVLSSTADVTVLTT